MENFWDLIPYIFTFLAALVPSVITVIAKTSKVQREFAEAVSMTSQLGLEVTGFIKTLAESTKDGKIDRAEYKQLKKDVNDVELKLAPFAQEWKDVLVAVKELTQGSKK